MKVVGIKEVVESLASKRGSTKKEAEGIMNDVLDVLVDKLCEGGISFKGVFTIKQRTQKGRSGKMNGKAWKTDDKQVLSFKMGKDLEEKLNK